MSPETRILTIALGATLLSVATANAQPACDRIEQMLISSSQSGLRDPGATFNVFDGPDDNAIYYSAADWIRDPDVGEFLDGLVDLNFGMNFTNAGEMPEGFDRQVKQLHEYRLAPIYAAGITSSGLQSATIQIYFDRVIDMTFNGATNLPGPEFMYVNVFDGDGLLTTEADAQIDYDRCDRKLPATWDITARLESERGVLITQDEIDFYGGTIIFEIDVTEQVGALLDNQTDFAGFSMAGSLGNHFVLMSVDGGDGTFAQLPRLILVGPVRGDLDTNNTVDLNDFALFQGCFSGAGNPVATGCGLADLDGDGDADTDDLANLEMNLMGPMDLGTCGTRLALSPVGSESLAASRPLPLFGDFNNDDDVGPADPPHFERCVKRGPAIAPECAACDLNRDDRLDEADTRLFKAIFRQ